MEILKLHTSPNRLRHNKTCIYIHFGDQTTMARSPHDSSTSIAALIETPIGRPKTVSDDYLNRLKELASQSPRHFGYPFERWTAQYLQRRLAQEFEVQVSDRHIHRLLKQMGLSTRHSVSSQRCPKIAINDLNHDLKISSKK
jgi:Homeodomain-like domain